MSKNKNKKPDKVLRTFGILTIFLSLGAVFAGYWLCVSRGSSLRADMSYAIEISSQEDIEECADILSNKDLTLSRDISLENADLTFGSSERPFEGTFDGNGHTVTLSGSWCEANTSLFGMTAESAVIKNVNFVFEGALSCDGGMSAGIAVTNRGRMENCSVTFDGFVVSVPGIYSAAVAVNYGTIEHVFVDVAFSADTDASAIYFGPVCGFNYGTIDGAVSIPVFEDSAGTESQANRGIAAVCAVTAGEGTVTNAAAVLDDSVYVCDRGDGIEIYADAGALLGSGGDAFTRFGFDDVVWEIYNAGTRIRVRTADAAV